MSWEHTDISMAARAGRLDELRSQGTNSQQLRDLIKENRSRRIHSIRSQVVKGLLAVADLIAPSEVKAETTLSIDSSSATPTLQI